MLCRLAIRDFVLVDRLELEFQDGFGALTGETGAGKSILVDALAFVLGERADTGLIRTGCERAGVSAEFDVQDNATIADWLREQDLDLEGGGLILRRVVDTASAFSLPAFTYWAAAGIDTHSSGTCPPITSVTAGPPPLYGTWTRSVRVRSL